MLYLNNQQEKEYHKEAIKILEGPETWATIALKNTWLTGRAWTLHPEVLSPASVEWLRARGSLLTCLLQTTPTWKTCRLLSILSVIIP